MFELGFFPQSHLENTRFLLLWSSYSNGHDEMLNLKKSFFHILINEAWWRNKNSIIKKSLCCCFKTLICCNLVFLNISYEYGYAAYIDKYRLVSNHLNYKSQLCRHLEVQRHLMVPSMVLYKVLWKPTDTYVWYWNVKF